MTARAKIPTGDRIHFPVPIVLSMKPERKSTMTVVEKPTDDDRGNTHMKEYLRKENLYKELRDVADALGYGIGSIVSERTNASMIPALVPHNWGVVTAHCAYKHNEKDFRPLEVSWLRKGKQNTFHFVEDLYVVHPSIPRDELELEFQIQDEDFRGVTS